MPMVGSWWDVKYGEKTEILENETQKLYDLEYGEKHCKT
jgi:hypothetical protein